MRYEFACSAFVPVSPGAWTGASIGNRPLQVALLHRTMAHVDHENRIAEYLLGQLPAAEAERLEQEFLSDDSRYEEVLAVEDELLLEYARGRLALPDRTR